MGYVNAKAPSAVYHLTPKKNLDAIIRAKAIKRFGDTECWFCDTLKNLKTYMEYTVLQEGKYYIDKDQTAKKYPRFEADDYVVLRLVPRSRQDRWVRWMQVVSPKSSAEMKAQAEEFSNSKIGYRGDLRFSSYDILSVGDVLMGSETPWKENAEKRKQQYFYNMRVEAQDVKSTAYALPQGIRGSVLRVDSIGYVVVKWDDGRILPVDPDKDSFKVLTPEELYDEKYDVMQAEFINGINRNVVPSLSLSALGKAYETQDMQYMTDLLRSLHNEFVSAYESDSVYEDMDFVTVPAVVLGANDKIYLALLTIDASSSGELWDAQFFTPYGIYDSSENNNHKAQQYMKEAFPYKYWYTVRYDGDIHTDMDDCPDKIKEMLTSVQSTQTMGEMEL